MKLREGDVDVTAGTGFRGDTPVPLVRLTVTTTEPDQVATIWMRPLEARAIGLDLIGAAHGSIGDCQIRLIAKREGLDGDGLIGEHRFRTEAELGPG
jgi:hypothetical protein